MYTDRKQSRLLVIIAAVVCVLLIAVLAVRMDPGKNINEESAASIKDAVMRSATQCYVVEGAYPANLAYLQENYGLQINTDDFYVTYDIFAQNMPPNVRVNVKNK